MFPRSHSKRCNLTQPPILEQGGPVRRAKTIELTDLSPEKPPADTAEAIAQELVDSLYSNEEDVDDTDLSPSDTFGPGAEARMDPSLRPSSWARSFVSNVVDETPLPDDPEEEVDGSEIIGEELPPAIDPEHPHISGPPTKVASVPDHMHALAEDNLPESYTDAISDTTRGSDDTRDTTRAFLARGGEEFAEVTGPISNAGKCKCMGCKSRQIVAERRPVLEKW